MRKINFLDLKKLTKNIDRRLISKEVLDSGWYLLGEKNKEFEQNFSNYCGTEYCISVGNGLDALSLILKGYEIGIGDEVIIPCHTFIATALAVSLVGAKPVFVEPEEKTFNINASLIEKSITNKTKAIITCIFTDRLKIWILLELLIKTN